MAQPWSGNKPDAATLVQLYVDSDRSSAEIAAMYGVTRQTVDYWLRSSGVESKYSLTRLNHRQFLPWRLTVDDSMDGIARALRAWSKESQGAPLSASDRNQLRRLREFLEPRNLVVDYSRESGFSFPPRDPEIDDPDLPIRRPTGQADA